MRTKPVIRFTEEEARQKCGRQVRTLVEFSAVPMGTLGRIVEIYQTEEGSFDVVIEWELPLRESPLRDRFAKEPYEQMLTENVNTVLAYSF